MRTIKGKKVTWIDIFKPNEEDVAALKKLHRFHPVILDEVLHPSSRTHIDQYGDYLFLVYHFPEYDMQTKTSRKSEIDMLITKNTIITIHYDNIEHLNTFFDLLSRNQKERDRVLATDTLLATYDIFEKAIAFSLRQLHHIEEQVASVGRDLFAGQEEKMLRTISEFKRNIVDYRLIIHAQEKFFSELISFGNKFWGDRSRVYTTDLANDSAPIHRNLENYFQTIESYEKTNAQLLDSQTNRTIKRFTVGAFIFTIPLYFAFYSEFEPFKKIIASSPTHFWTSFTVIHASVITLWFIFKKKKIF